MLGELPDDSIHALGDGRALVFDRTLGDAIADTVRRGALSLLAGGQLRRAGVGRNGVVVTHTRGDFITWLDPAEAPPAFAPVLELFAALMQTLNRTAYLGARTLEVQLAVYEPGFGYERHRDALAGSSSRRATVIYYANPWQPGDGGELEVWEGEGTRVIEPLADRLVVFRSDVLEHAVREVNRGPRVAVSGWLRTV
ncbi:MAG TPA: 2OG-Fe(II) oxygenase [Enhygromyxa sp.]|nr:2OG-Fe(II) oxygenase [Enhygromyxa sp.]